MAKDHRPSGNGVTPPGVAKRGRNTGTGQFAEASAARQRARPTTLELRGPQSTGKQVSGNHRIIRSIRSGKMVEAVMHAAADEGLITAKNGRIAGRVSSELIAKARARTGLTSDTDLLEFALATIAIEDNFAEAFHAVRGTIDPDIDFGF